MESGQTRVPRGLVFAQCTGLVQDALRSFTLEYKSHQWLWVPVRRAITFPDRGSNSTANSHAGCTLLSTLRKQASKGDTAHSNLVSAKTSVSWATCLICVCFSTCEMVTM